jgi:hypothetical protein
LKYLTLFEGNMTARNFEQERCFLFRKSLALTRAKVIIYSSSVCLPAHQTRRARSKFGGGAGFGNFVYPGRQVKPGFSQKKKVITWYHFTARFTTGFTASFCYIAAFPPAVREFVAVKDYLGSLFTELQISLINMRTERKERSFDELRTSQPNQVAAIWLRR